MAGPDSGEESSCRQLAKKLNVEEEVTFCGLLSKPEINKVASRRDIFLNTSSIDNTPATDAGAGRDHAGVLLYDLADADGVGPQGVSLYRSQHGVDLIGWHKGHQFSFVGHV